MRIRSHLEHYITRPIGLLLALVLLEDLLDEELLVGVVEATRVDELAHHLEQGLDCDSEDLPEHLHCLQIGLTAHHDLVKVAKQF